MAKLFVPGRLCLLGEHSDWASNYNLYRGHCIVVGTDQGLIASAEESSYFEVTSHLPDGTVENFKCRWDLDELRQAAQDRGQFFRYCAGTAYVLKLKNICNKGMRLNITGMDLPLGKGVSSSAAVCVLTVKAFNEVYDLGLFIYEIMSYAFDGELATGSKCGRMDQACVYGSRPVLLSFDPRQINIEPFGVGNDIHMFFVDLNGNKNTKAILDDLQASYQSVLSPKQIASKKTIYNNNLVRALGPENERIVRSGYKALRCGDARLLGEIMYEAQEIFDNLVSPASTFLESPLLNSVLECDTLKPWILGGKGVGSQGDGTAQFICASNDYRTTAMSIVEGEFPGMKCFPLTIKQTPIIS